MVNYLSVAPFDLHRLMMQRWGHKIKKKQDKIKGFVLLRFWIKKTINTLKKCILCSHEPKSVFLISKFECQIHRFD